MESNLVDKAATFLETIAKRIERDNGAKAVMKRALAGDDRHLRHTYPLVLPLLTNVRESQQNLWIFVASLSVYYPQPIGKEGQNFGFSCKRLSKETASGGVERRFRALLDLSLEDIEKPITSLIRQMKSKGIAISYPLLLADLCQWEHPDQYIQDRWAKTFWSSFDAMEEDQI